MKPIHIFLLACLFPLTNATAQQATPAEQEKIVSTGQPGKHLNFFIISKRKKGKLDLATRFNVLRTKLRSFFRKDFVAIVASDPDHMSREVRERLERKNAGLGTIWFDSHGMYKKGYSLFYIGHAEVSYHTLKDSIIKSSFEELSAYADENTKVIIGSCYGGATYERTPVDYRDTTRMNGDSLMISLGKLIRNGTVYGSESWVMSKPGLFWRRPAVGGNPGRKLFLDICYEPAWKTIGVWNEYNTSNNSFTRINPVTLDAKGNLLIRGLPYTVEKNAQKDINKKLEKLRTGLYK